MSSSIPRPGERAANGGVGDGSLLPVETDVAALWKGWTCVASPSGRLFYYHTGMGVSQWHQPPELLGVIGDWQPVHPADGQPFWYNRLLGISLWKDPTNTTNIFQAALDGNTFFLHLYNEVGGSLEVQDPKGRSSLHYACAGGSLVFADFLISQSVDVSVPDQISATTPLLLSCRYGHAEITRRLLEANARVDESNDLGDTALHEAAQLGQVDCVAVLLQYGAPVRALNAENRTPEMVATLGRHSRAAQMIQAAEDNPPPPVSVSGYAARAKSARFSHARRKTERERERVAPESDDDSRSGDESEHPSQGFGLLAAVSPALQSARAALSKVFPTKADLGLPNAYVFDEHSHQWVLRNDR